MWLWVRDVTSISKPTENQTSKPASWAEMTQCADELKKTYTNLTYFSFPRRAVRLRLTVDASTLLIIFIPVLFKNNAQKGLTN